MLNGPERTLKRARQLRKVMSPPELILWKALRQRPQGLKFRRQHPAGDYIVDFYCHAAQLAVEVDGATHDGYDAERQDAAKRHWLRSQGVRVIRISASSIATNLCGVVDQIAASAVARLPLHQPAAGPPPPLGEEA